jgi:hypothetical protein
LVVASPLLLAAPVSASPDRPSPAVAAVPAAPPAVQSALPAAPAPVTVAPPAVDAATGRVLLAPAVRAVPTTTKVPAAKPVPADLNDAAYSARLQADLCQARQIFCGLDRSGHYPAG